MSGTASAVSRELDALEFTPVGVGPGNARATGFALSDVSSVLAPPTVDNTTSVLDSDPVVPPVITGAVASQPVDDTSSLKPFVGIAITDTNTPQKETATVTLDQPGNGILDSLGAGVVDGAVFTVSGTAADIEAALRALVFVPSRDQAAPGETTTSHFALMVSETLEQASDTTTSVIATSINDAPTITGTSSNQATTDQTTITPFNAGFGVDTLTGFHATGTTHDTIQFDTAAVADYQTLKGMMSVSGNDTVIAITAQDSLTIKGVTSGLTSQDFTFVTHDLMVPA